MTEQVNKFINKTFIRYVIGGLIAFFTEYGIFLGLFYVLGIQENIAHSISYILAILVNFSILRWWVFKYASNNNFVGQATKYLFLVFINFCLSNVLIYISILINIPAYLGKIATMLMIILWNYLIMKAFIFRTN